MASPGSLTTYVKKLSHPLQEIRERSLQLLIAKLRLGWELEDELAGTRALFEAIISWFHFEQPTLQREALSLLSSILKSQSGTYIAKQHGIQELINKLRGYRNRIDFDALEIYNDIIDSLSFVNTVDSEENVAVPQLDLRPAASTESLTSTSSYYNAANNIHSSRDTSISNDRIQLSRDTAKSNSVPGISLLLFPWVELCQSDIKTLSLIENALCVLKSTRRCCRFIRDVFLRDFPAEIFLNRPKIVQQLTSILSGEVNGGKIFDACQVLLCIMRSLSVRRRQLLSVELVHESKQAVYASMSEDDLNVGLFELGGGASSPPPAPPAQPHLAPLRQAPAPHFALDTTHVTLGALARSIALVDEHGKEVLDRSELKSCIELIEASVRLLVECVPEEFWSVDHSTNTHRDIAHKSCMVMRLLADLLAKYRDSYTNDVTRRHHFAAWLRLVRCATTLAHWSRECALPPKALIPALQTAQLDQSLEIHFPNLYGAICDVLKGKKIMIDTEYKTKYRELKKLFESINEHVQFLKNKNNIRCDKSVLTCISKSLPVLDLHTDENFIQLVGEVLFKRVVGWNMTCDDWSLARTISLTLMAHSSDFVRGKFYSMLLEMVKRCLTGEDSDSADNEKCLTLICDVSVLIEVCCHGLNDKSKEVVAVASELMVLLLRGRMLVSGRCWTRLLASLTPVLPLLQLHAAPGVPLGEAILRALDPEIAECMGVARSEVLIGWTRLLFLNNPPVQMDAAHALCHMLDDPKYLPPKDSLRADVLISALRRVQKQNFNVDDSTNTSGSVQTAAVAQLLEVLKQDMVAECPESEAATKLSRSPQLEPSLRRATLQQLAAAAQRRDTHAALDQHGAANLVVDILRMSLAVEDYLAFPECAVSCVSLLNSVAYRSRRVLASVPDLPAMLLRAILIFPANDSLVSMAAQVLCVIGWSGFLLQQMDASRQYQCALPQVVVERTNLPMPVLPYWSTSANSQHSTVDWLQSSDSWRSAIRLRWSYAWVSDAGHRRAPPGPLSLRPTPQDAAAARLAAAEEAVNAMFMDLQNATTHAQVLDTLAVLEMYTPLQAACATYTTTRNWDAAVSRYLLSPPGSRNDVVLLTALLRYVAATLQHVRPPDESFNWIKSTFFDNPDTIISLLCRDQMYPSQTSQDSIEVTQLHIHIVKVLLHCVLLQDVKSDCDAAKIESLLKILLVCLEKVDLKNFHMLGYLNELTRCIRYIVNLSIPLSELTVVQSVFCVGGVVGGCAAGGGRKGAGVRLDAMLALLAAVNRLEEMQVPVERWSDAWCGGAAAAVYGAARAPRPDLRAAALLVLAALAKHAALLSHLTHALECDSLCQFAASIFCDKTEANVVRTAAAALLTSVTSRVSPQTDVYEMEWLHQLHEQGFVEVCFDLFLDFCSEREPNNNIEPNIPLSILENRSALEVRASKCADVCVTPAQTQPPPAPDAALVVAAAETLYNVAGFDSTSLQAWNDRGLFRVMFKCSTCLPASDLAALSVRRACCRAIRRASRCRAARAALAATSDCLHHLLGTMMPFKQGESTEDYLSCQSQAMFALAALLPDRTAADFVWNHLSEKRDDTFLHLILQCLEFDENEHPNVQESALHCLMQLTESIPKKQGGSDVALTRTATLERLPSPSLMTSLSSGEVTSRARLGAGDEQCKPELLVEELVEALMKLFQRLMPEKKFQCNEGDVWTLVCGTLSSVLQASGAAREWARHRSLHAALLAALLAARHALTLHGNTTDTIRNVDTNPILRAVHWILTTLASSMVNSVEAKEAVAASDVAAALARLWPWCMLAEHTRIAALNVLLIYTNNCPAAWATVSTCVSGRTLVGEVCACAVRGAARASRARGDATLVLSLAVLANCKSQAAASIMIKSDILSCAVKLRGYPLPLATARLLRLAEVLARRPAGAAAVLASLRSLPAPHSPPVAVLVAHAAHHHRADFLHQEWLLDQICGGLAGADPLAVMHYARAAWSLAANCYKAKLALRSAGVTAAVEVALQRMRRASPDSANQEAIQMLTYTCSVLQNI